VKSLVVFNRGWSAEPLFAGSYVWPPSKQVQKAPWPVKVATVELHVANSGARYAATIIPQPGLTAFKVDGLR